MTVDPITRLNRRHLLKAGAAAIVCRSLPAQAVTTQAPIDVVERFGFVADGRTDNYAAFHRLAAYATARGGGRFRFPPGTYYVARYRTTKAYQRAAFRAERPNDVTNAVYFRCNGLELIGQGARIKLNGRFHRGRGRGEPLLAAVFMPFEFRLCRNVVISGFDIDGGVREMTRDPDVTEAYAALIGLNGSRNVVLRDLNLHHCQTDAVYLGDDATLSGERGVACRDITLERVICTSNARGALAALQVLGLTCTDCAFNGSAYGTGAYGRHAPGFGVDVEPDRYLPADVDTMTGNLHFQRCQFHGNFSAFLAAYTNKYQGFLRLIDCRSSNANNAPNHMIIAWPGAVVQGGQHDLGKGTFWTCWSGKVGGRLSLRSTTIKGSGPFGLFHAYPGNVVELTNVAIVGTHSAPTFGVFPAIEADPGAGQRNLMRNCRIFIPKARKSPQPEFEPISSINHALCEGNLFETDLPDSDGRHFVVMYGDDCVVRNDRFLGRAPGLHDTIAPNSAHDTRLSYSRS